MDDIFRFVDFETWCKRCVNKDLDEAKSPCNECLDKGSREQTEKPLYFEEKK